VAEGSVDLILLPSPPWGRGWSEAPGEGVTQEQIELLFLEVQTVRKVEIKEFIGKHRNLRMGAQVWLDLPRILAMEYPPRSSAR